MSLEYYLCCRKKYYEIISNLDNILESYDTIYYCMSKYENLDFQYIQKMKEKTFFIKKREYIISQRNKYNDIINKLCNHEFEEDMIDITPEKSQKITYCKICEYTK